MTQEEETEEALLYEFMLCSLEFIRSEIRYLTSMSSDSTYRKKLTTIGEEAERLTYMFSNGPKPELEDHSKPDARKHMLFYNEIFRRQVLRGREVTVGEISRSEKVMEYASIIRQYSDQYGVPANIMAALIHQESSGIPDITASALGSSARGLGQFMPETARNLGLRVDGEVDDRTNPDKSINAMARHLSDLANKYDGDYSKALIAYHEGEPRANKIISLLESGETAEAIAAMHTNKVSGTKELLTYLTNIKALSGEY